jgi:hypothetical protein
VESLDGNMDYSRTCVVSREYQYFSHRLSWLLLGELE